MSTTGNAGEQYFENLFNPNTGADALQDIEDFTDFMETFDTVTTGHVLLKQSEDPREFGGIAKTSTYSASDSNLVERESGKIKTNTLQVGTADGGSSDLNIKTSTGASASLIGSDNLTLNLIRNGGGSDAFGGDGSSDWRLRNGGGNFFLERGNSGLSNGYASILTLPFGNSVEINRRLTGELIETVPLRMYRQISGGTTNADYIDLKPDSITGTYTQLFPALDGTFILDSTTEYVGLNSLRDNYNARTTGTLIKKDSGDDAVGEEAFDEANTASTIVKRTSSNQINATNFVAPTGGNVYINDFRLHQVSGQNYVDFNGPVNFRVGGTSTNFALNYSGYTWSMVGTGRISGTSSKLSFSSDAALEIDAAGVVGGRLNVGTNGRVGIGCTSTFPAQHELDVNGTTPVIRISSYSTGSVGSPALEFVRGSQTYGGDDYADWRIQNYNGDLVFNIGSTYSTHVNGDVLKLTEEGQIYAGIASQTDGASTSDLIITKNNETQVEIELRSDRPTASNSDYQVGKIIGGFTSTDYRDAYIKLQTHNALTGNLVDTLTATNNRIGINDSTPSYTLDVNGTVRTQGGNVLFEAATQITGTLTTSNTSIGGTLTVTGVTNLGNSLVIQGAGGVAKITLEDSTDHDDIDILFRGYNGATLIDNAVIRTENNYLNLETLNNSPMNGIRLRTNDTLAVTVDNDQNVELAGGLGIGKTVATGFALDVDGMAIFRDSQTYVGQASYAGTFPAVYSVGLALQSGTFSNDLDTVTLTANRNINFPDADGTVALTSDIPWTTTGSDIYYNSGNVFIGQTSGSEALEVTGNIKSTGNVQCNELQGTLGSSTKIDLTPGGGNIDIIVPNSSGSPSPNVDINFKTGSDIRMNLNSIDGLVFHDAFIFRNDVGSTYFPLSFNGAVANQLNIGTDTVNISTGDLTLASGDLTLTAGDLHIDAGSVEVDLGNVHLSNGNMYIGAIPGSVPIGIQNLYVEAGTTTAGVQAHVGVAVMGNGLADYAMFSHESHHTTGNYALLQQNDGETFLNCASTKQIHFRVNNSTRGGMDDETGAVRVFFIVPAATKPTYDSLGKIKGDYNSLDNITFRQFTTGGTQNERTHMYSQVVVDSSTTPFTQQALELQDYGTQPGFVSGSPGFAFRVADPNRHAQIHCSFSGYTTSSNALQTVKLQLYSKQTTGTNAWVDICTFDFYVNDLYQHVSFSFSKRVQVTHSYYSYARFVLVSGTFTGDTGDFFHLTIDQLPRLTR